jgi:flavin-dependent dehydrogenase
LTVARRVAVAVVGGGVAGLATALALAPRQRVLLCASEAKSAPGGETLIAAADRLLCELGFVARPKEAFAPRVGAASVWGSETIERRDSFLDPRGDGWRLNRIPFEARLAALARSRGVVFGPAPTRIASRSQGWLLNSGARAWRARALVDATGRACAVGRAIGVAKPLMMDNLICRTIRLPTEANVKDLEQFSLVEAAPQGWWHRATEPDGGVVIAFYTDADLPTARRTRTIEGFASALGETREARRGFELSRCMRSRIASTAARSQRSQRVHGHGWLAVGDAAIALDPLSSAGLFNALYLGVRSARAIELWLSSGGSEIAAYSAEVDRIWTAYLKTRQSVYGLAGRFAGEEFWRRRAGVGESRSR